MLNMKTIYKSLGTLLLIESSLMFYCLAMSLYYGEDDMPSFLISIITTMLFGFLFRHLGLNSDNTLGRRDAYLLVSVTWVLFSLFGTLPFLISGYIDNFTDAFFETMSGFTTTGATIIDDVEALPHGLLFWRSFTQWIGGLGIVFFTIALLPSMGGGSVKVFAAEATGPIRSKLHPRLKNNAKSIWIVYIVLTLVALGALLLCGMDPFNALNFAMSSAATGGFSTTNGSLVSFHSAAEEYVVVGVCLLSGINFSLLYIAVVRGKIKSLLKNSEARFYLCAIGAFTLFIMAELLWRNHYALEHAFRSALFQVVSFTTTTGLFNDDAAQWPHVTWIVLAVCMFVGGCSGSTAGGIKSIRCVMLIKVVANEFKQILHPNAVLALRVDGANVPFSKRVTLLAFLSLYIMLAVACAFVMTAFGVDFVNSITITLSCLGNVGPTLGVEIGPTMSWSSLPVFAKWISSFLMLVGRLELFSVMVLFSPEFWRRN